MNAGETGKFQCELIFPEDSDLTILEEMAELAKSIWWPTRKASVTWPIKDGKVRVDKETGEIRSGYEFAKFISPRSDDKPEIVIGREMIPCTDSTQVYGGGYVIADLSAFGYERSTGDGVSFALNSIWWIRDGEPFTSRRSAVEAFAGVDVPDEMFDAEAYGVQESESADDDEDLL